MTHTPEQIEAIAREMEAMATFHARQTRSSVPLISYKDPTKVLAILADRKALMADRDHQRARGDVAEEYLKAERRYLLQAHASCDRLMALLQRTRDVIAPLSGSSKLAHALLLDIDATLAKLETRADG